MYFFFYSAISGSFYALFKLKESLFNKVYNRITIISYKARTFLFNLELYSFLFKFKSFIFIVLSFIVTFLLYVLRFILGLVPLFKLFNILRPRPLNILY
jgi:hypothetical protein